MIKVKVWGKVRLWSRFSSVFGVKPSRGEGPEWEELTWTMR
jgi:hypothetical protein